MWTFEFVLWTNYQKPVPLCTFFHWTPLTKAPHHQRYYQGATAYDSAFLRTCSISHNFRIQSWNFVSFPLTVRGNHTSSGKTFRIKYQWLINYMQNDCYGSGLEHNWVFTIATGAMRLSWIKDYVLWGTFGYIQLPIIQTGPSSRYCR